MIVIAVACAIVALGLSVCACCYAELAHRYRQLAWMERANRAQAARLRNAVPAVPPGWGWCYIHRAATPCPQCEALGVVFTRGDESR